jgi:Uma2 family endonuclease
MGAHRGTLVSMAEAAKRAATYEDLCAVPDTRVAEILFGVLYSFPRPASPHAVASSALGEELGPPFKRGRGGPGGWVILDEPELHLGADILVPDLGGWRRERMPVIPETAAFTLGPDWVCEVLSPSTAAIDKTDKASIYARENVQQMWHLDPLSRTLEVFQLENGRYFRHHAWRDDAVVRAEPFDAIELELSVLWAR